MSRILTLLFVLSAGLVAHAQSQAPATAPSRPAEGTPTSAAALTDDQKTLYALGLAMQRSIRPFDLSPEEMVLVMRAISDGAAGTPAVDLNEWGPRIQPLANARGLRVTTREKAAGAAYLETAAAELGAIRTASGLIYLDLTAGGGPSPTARDTVKVHYRGTLLNGTVFDSWYERNEPAVFALAGVVPCWTEGVQRMKVGGKARLVCPSSLAYGDAGSPTIPGGAALIFEVELLEIVGAAARPLN